MVTTWSEFESCCDLEQESLPSHCLSPPRSGVYTVYGPGQTVGGYLGLASHQMEYLYFLFYAASETEITTGCVAHLSPSVALPYTLTKFESKLTGQKTVIL